MCVVRLEISASGRSLVQTSPTECVCVISCNNNPLRLQWVDRTGQTKKEIPTKRWKMYYIVNYLIFGHCSRPVFWDEQYNSDRIVSVYPRGILTRQNLKEAHLTFHITVSLGGRMRFSLQYAVFCSNTRELTKPRQPSNTQVSYTVSVISSKGTWPICW